MKIIIYDDYSKEIDQIMHLLCENDLITYTSKERFIDDVLQSEKFNTVLLGMESNLKQEFNSENDLKEKFKKLIVLFMQAYTNLTEHTINYEELPQLKSHSENNGTTKDALEKLCVKLTKEKATHTVKYKNIHKTIQVCDIMYIECYQKHIIYHTDYYSFETAEKLSNVYQSLKNYDFCQVHQGYVVNLDKISHLEKNLAVLKNGKELPISRQRKTDVRQTYLEYTKKYN